MPIQVTKMISSMSPMIKTKSANPEPQIKEVTRADTLRIIEKMRRAKIAVDRRPVKAWSIFAWLSVSLHSSSTAAWDSVTFAAAMSASKRVIQSSFCRRLSHNKVFPISLQDPYRRVSCQGRLAIGHPMGRLTRETHAVYIRSDPLSGISALVSNYLSEECSIDVEKAVFALRGRAAACENADRDSQDAF